MNNLVLTHIKELVGITESSNAPKRGADQNKVDSIQNAYLIIRNGLIDDFGPMSELPDSELEQYDCTGKMVLPMYIDSHTHMVFAQGRGNEFEMRLEGKSYQEIAEAGGGILNSARKLTAMSEQDLFEAAQDRLQQAVKQGTGALEIKSGYGLSLESELKMLRVIQVMKHLSPIPIKATFLGAHALPEEFKNNKTGYIDLVCNEMIPAIGTERLADYVDIFCETGYFDLDDMKRVIEAGAKYNMKAKVHVNQFNSFGAVPLACEMNALSVDHLEVMSDADYDTMAANPDTLAVALPLCSLFLDIPYTPGRELIDRNIPVVLASDFNPGSAPSSNLSLAFALACSQMKLTVNEAFNALTYNAAFALELQDELGSIQRGKKAHLMITRPGEGLRDIPYWFGESRIESVIV